jgi:hypothetical protein
LYGCDNLHTDTKTGSRWARGSEPWLVWRQGW